MTILFNEFHIFEEQNVHNVISLDTSLSLFHWTLQIKCFIKHQKVLKVIFIEYLTLTDNVFYKSIAQSVHYFVDSVQ